jgi:hypothetical protein
MAEITRNGARDGGIPAEIVEVSAEELLAEVDRGARERLHMSGWEEFAEKYHRGLLPDTLAVNELGILLESAEESRV